MLLWWLLTSTIKVQEAVAGFGAAAVAATAMVAIRGSTPSLARFRVRWLKPVWLWPAVVIRDMAGLAGVLWRQLTEGRVAHGSFREIPMAAPDNDPLKGGKELAVTVGVSSTPNTIVLGFDREREVLVIHQAVPRQARSIQDLLSPR
jgi:multisubunit Na+/H+ antiporter MnhE subunit